MLKLGKMKNVLGDITVEDMVVCPIDDHVTIGISSFNTIVPEIQEEFKSRPILLSNNIMIEAYLL